MILSELDIPSLSHLLCCLVMTSTPLEGIIIAILQMKKLRFRDFSQVSNLARSITCKQQIKVGCVLVKPKANHGSLLAEETSYFSPTDLYLLHFFHPWSYTFYQYRERKVEAKGHLNNVSSLINLYLVKKKQNDRCGLFKMTAQLSMCFFSVDTFFRRIHVNEL